MFAGQVQLNDKPNIANHYILGTGKLSCGSTTDLGRTSITIGPRILKDGCSPRESWSITSPLSCWSACVLMLGFFIIALSLEPLSLSSLLFFQFFSLCVCDNWQKSHDRLPPFMQGDQRPVKASPTPTLLSRSSSAYRPRSSSDALLQVKAAKVSHESQF